MKKAFLFSMILIALEVVAAGILYRHLPASIPTHWNAAGVIDSYGDKTYIFLAPGISLFLTLLLYYLPNFVPKGENIKKSGKAYPVTIVMTNLLMAIILIITATAAFGIPTPVEIIIPVATGILMLGIGNYMPKIKPNYFFGIRMPWTLASELVWTKTHRVGGWVFLGIGVLFLLGVLLPAPINFILPMGGLFIGLLFITGYAYVVYKQTNGEKQAD